MDPIKVDFTKKKDDGIIIKPAKAGLKIFLNILITLVGAGIAYYIMLPPMNFKSTDMYIFFVIVALIYVQRPRSPRARCVRANTSHMSKSSRLCR